MSEIIIRCKNCNTELAAPVEFLGQEVRCCNCQTPQIVEAPKPASDSETRHKSPQDSTPVKHPPAYAPVLNIGIDQELEMPIPGSSSEPENSFESEIIFRCLGCQSILAAPREHIGYNVRCDECDAKMPVPEKSNVSFAEDKTPEPETADFRSSALQEKDVVPKLRPPPGKNLPKAPIAMDDDDDDKFIPKLRPPPKG